MRFKDGRRKHQHWEAAIFYEDGEKFIRKYVNRAQADKFAQRQKKSPIVRGTRVRLVA